jgi:uncharacterized membrane protein YsdA (DUF1294 family)
MMILFAYLLILNLIGFLFMGLDKFKARKRRWRIPEARLFLLAAIGGSLGIWMGMSVFRHKTKHLAFQLGIPGILLGQVVLIVVLLMKYPNFLR